MSQPPALSTRAWFELALLGLIWGAVFLAVRVGLDELSVLHAVAHRLIWAALLLWIWALVAGYDIPRAPRIWAALAVMGLLNNVLPFTLITWAQTGIESGMAAILNAATALFGVLAAALFFADERLSAARGLGVMLGFAGVVTAIGWQSLLSFDPRAVSQLAMLGAAMSYALAGVWARKRLAGLRPQVAALGMVTVSALVMLAASWAIDGPLPMALAPVTWAAIFYYAVIATALAYLLYYRILAMAGAGNLMLVTLLIPPVAIVLGAVVRGESLAPNALAGFGLIALGLVILDGRLLRRRAALRQD